MARSQATLDSSKSPSPSSKEQIMSEFESDWNRLEMHATYESSQTARILLDGLAGRGRNVNVNCTLVDDVVAETRCPRHEAIALLQRFEACGCGRFVSGRRGQPSRFEWSYPAIEVAKEAVQETNLANSRSPVNGDGVKFLDHTIWCRPEVRLNLRLPADLTQAEAEKIAGVIRNLWLTSGGES
jgi:hypothetical protein